MSDIKETAIRKAIQILNGAGAQYKIISEGGVHYGALEAVKPSKKRNSYKAIYRETMAQLEVGGVAKFDGADKAEANGIRTAAQAYAISLWGTGSTISECKGTSVEILRVL